MQDLNISQLKLQVRDSYTRDEKMTTNFECNNDEDDINKDEKLK